MRNLKLSPNTSMVDVAGGTGDIAFRAVREMQTRYVVSCWSCYPFGKVKVNTAQINV